MKKIECYETEDGKLFTNYAEAIMHEKEEDIKSNLNKALNGGIVTSDLMKKCVGDDRLCVNLSEAQSLKRFLVDYITEVMMNHYTAFKSIFDGELL